MHNDNYGTLYLLPAPLAEGVLHSIPAEAIGLLHKLDHFITERGKTTRQFMKASGISRPLQELHFYEMNKRTSPQEYKTYIQPLLKGEDVGLLSEAGCPGIADPGSHIVRLAHKHNIRVKPVSGPSSILLALISSGLNGQSFSFHGYLTPKREQLPRELQRLEQAALRFGQTQLFMETPYRNKQVIEAALATLQPTTYFGIASMLTTPQEYILCQPADKWQNEQLPDLHKLPTVFLVGKG